MGWGTGSWGGSPWGGGAASIAFDYAVAVDLRRVRVYLTAAPLATSPWGVGDALNPDSWTLTRLDSGAAFTITSAETVSNLAIDLRTVEALGPKPVTHRVASEVIRTASGVLVTAPKFADFAGLRSASALADQRAGLRQRDLRNEPTPRAESVGGTLVIGSDGDYELHQGAELVRKLILRRLTTVPGEFSHLPTYGIGLRSQEPLPTADLIKLRARITEQVRREPEVSSARVALQMNATGVLTVQVLAKLRTTGETVEIVYAAPDAVLL